MLITSAAEFREGGAGSCVDSLAGAPAGPPGSPAQAAQDAPLTVFSQNFLFLLHSFSLSFNSGLRGETRTYVPGTPK